MAIQSKRSPLSGLSSWQRPFFYWLLLASAVAILALAVIAIADIVRDAENAPSQVTLAGGDSGREIEVAPEGTIVIRLDSNPTTGYSWAVDSLDDEVLTLTQDTYEAPVNGAIGQGGIQELRFASGASGESELVLKYWRPWEGDASVVERFTINVVVEK